MVSANGFGSSGVGGWSFRGSRGRVGGSGGARRIRGLEACGGKYGRTFFFFVFREGLVSEDSFMNEKK